MNTSKSSRLLFNKSTISVSWVLVWPFVSMIFKSNPHYPAYLKPIGVFFRNPNSNAPEGYYTSMSYILTDILPAAVFWLVLFVILIFVPKKPSSKKLT